MGLFRKNPPEPIERLFTAAEELTAAWAAMPNWQLRPWIDWKNRRVVITEYFDPEPLTLDEAKEAIND